MRIVIKYPTRGRPDKFTSTLERYINFLSGMHEVYFVVSFDHDDHTMNNDSMLSLFNRLNLENNHKIYPICGNSTGKVSAMNADMDKVLALDPEIIVLISDDMIPVLRGYDDIIAKNMIKYFSDTDGVLHFNDGSTGQDILITLPIVGEKYLERFGYLYYPGYKSVYCDNEFTDVARLLGKVVYFEQTIIQHEWIGLNSPDALHLYNESPEIYAHDELLYDERKARNYDLKLEKIINHVTPTK